MEMEMEMEMESHQLRHRMVRTNGINMHIAEQGSGPLVLLIHGFPELWFSWRHQIKDLAQHGYHVVAPDMRGYGDTDSPTDPASYTCHHLVGDLIGLLDELGHERAFVVGHDWGAIVAWYLCLFRPDRVHALFNLGVPYFPRSPTTKPSKSFAERFGEGFYMSQFQEYGRAEKAFARYDCYTVMKKILSINKTDSLISPLGMEFIDFLEVPSALPTWLNEEELQYFTSKFQKKGFTGPLNYYRAMDLNWELLAPWQGAKILVPTKYVVGDKDIGFEDFGTRAYITGSTFKSLVPNLEVEIIDGHHSIQDEKAQEVTAGILSFFGNHNLLYN